MTLIPPLTITPQNANAEHDQALERLHARGEEWPNGFSSHGPMVVESLTHAGRPDAITGWVEAYTPRLADRVPVHDPIDPATWAERLGDGASMGDWIAFFDRALTDDPWEDVVSRWFPRLAPGVVTAATHGLLRSAHAVRGLTGADNPVRRHELARGLGYWAARFETLPDGLSSSRGVAGSGTLPIAEALALVPLVPAHRRTAWMISDRVQQVDPAAFSEAVGHAAFPGDPYEGLRQVVVAGARLLIANPEEQITFIHSLTGPRSVVSVLPYLAEDEQHEAVRHAFVAVAALWSSTGVRPPETADADGGRGPERATPSWTVLLDHAIAGADEHHIKLTVAAHDAVLDGADESLLRAAAASVVRTPDA